MKKLLLLFVVMLGTLGAYAQSNTTPIKGDVNEDGVVDVADINAIIEIMKNGGGTAVDESAYFFYVGLEKPTSASNPAANVVGAQQMGWHLIGSSLDGYNATNPVYVGGEPSQTINVNPYYEDVYFYVAVPVGLSLHDGLGNVIDSLFLDTANVTINGHSYNIFKIYNSDFLASIY